MSDERRYDFCCPGCGCQINVWSQAKVEVRFHVCRSEESGQAAGEGRRQDADGDQRLRPLGLPAGIHAETTGSRKGRPLQSLIHLSNERVEPWKEAGMSRRTWYRRQQEKKS
jgi:hypothetical protein